MNETTIVEAVRNLLIDNEATLLGGIYFQGEQMQLGVVSTSTLTPPAGYPYTTVICPEVREASKNQKSNLQHPSRLAIYDIVIETTNQALVVDEEAFPYKQMTDDWRLFTDRIVYIIKTQTKISYGGQDAELLRGEGSNDRRITKRNLSGLWENTEQMWVAILNSQIRFSLAACPDDSLILPT